MNNWNIGAVVFFIIFVILLGVGIGYGDTWILLGSMGAMVLGLVCFAIGTVWSMFRRDEYESDGREAEDENENM